MYGLQPGDTWCPPHPLSDSAFNDRMNSEMAAIEQAIAWAVQPPAARAAGHGLGPSRSTAADEHAADAAAGYLPIFAPSS